MSRLTAANPTCSARMTSRCFHTYPSTCSTNYVRLTCYSLSLASQFPLPCFQPTHALTFTAHSFYTLFFLLTGPSPVQHYVIGVLTSQLHVPVWVPMTSLLSRTDNTGRFIMCSGITKMYYRKTQGHVFTKPVQTEGTTQKFFSPVSCFSL
jgi:hypothetical protein